MACPACGKGYCEKIKEIRNYTEPAYTARGRLRQHLKSIAFTYQCKACGKTWTCEQTIDKYWWLNPQDDIGCVCFSVFLIGVAATGFLAMLWIIRGGIDAATICVGYGFHAYFHEGLRFAYSRRGILINGQTIPRYLDAFRVFLLLATMGTVLVLVPALWRRCVATLAAGLKRWFMGPRKPGRTQEEWNRPGRSRSKRT